MIRTLGLCASAAAAILCLAAAQDAERVFQPGELVKPGGGQTYRILQCRPERVSREIECEVVLWKNGGAASIKQWINAAEIAAGEARVRDAEELAGMTDAPAAAPAPGAMPPATDPAAPQDQRSYSE